MTAAGAAGDIPALEGPYVGLTFYTQENAALFFGRDTERTVLISNLRAARLTLLYAQSGAGKSSLLRAGVASRLGELAQRGLKERGTARNIPVVFSSWRDDPTAGLIGAIQKAVIPFVPGALPAEFPRERLEEAIEAASRAADSTLLVMLDQFEEYFLYQSVEGRDRRFADEIAACINRPDLRTNFLISIREDAYSGLGDLFKGRIANVYGNYLHLEHLDTESARLAIEKPIGSFNELHGQEPPVEIEQDLVDTVLGQLRPDQFVPDQGGIGGLGNGNVAARAGDGIAAPYLQLVMKRLWESELSSGSRRLRLRTLEGLGGARTIVRTHVDRALGGLTDGDRDAAADILRHLVTPSGTKIALAASDLAEYTDRSTAETSALLERLAGSDTRILRPVPPPPGGEGGTRFEISHDLLAPTIVDWGRRNRARRLEDEKKAAERQAQTEKRRARMFRALAIGSGALLVLALFLLLFMIRANRTAQEAKHEAQLQARSAQEHKRYAFEQRNRAVSIEVAGESEALAQREPLLASLLAAAAWQIDHTAEAGASMLNVLAQPDHGVLFASQGHNPCDSVAFSPDGKTLVTVGADGTARLWDVQARRLIYTFTIRDTPVSSAAFSPDGKTLVTAFADGTVRRWEMATRPPAGPGGTGRLRHVATHRQVGGRLIAGHARVRAIAFSRNGKFLATAGADGAARLLDVRTGRQIRVFKASRTGAVDSLAFSRNGKFLATAGADGAARLWDVRTGRQIGVFKASRTGAVDSLAFSRNGKFLATAGADGTARLWDVATQREKGTPLRASAGAVYSVAFSPDGKTLAAAGADGTVRLWDVATGEEIGGAPLIATAGAVDSVAFSPDGKILATAGTDGTARLWDSAIYRQIGPSFGADRGAVYAEAFSRDGTVLATGGADGTARLWDVHSHRQIGAFKASRRGAVDAVALSRDGTVLATGGADGTARLWDVHSHRQIGAFKASRRGAVDAVALSGDGAVLATGGADGTARFWDVHSGRQIGAFKASRRGAVTAVAFSPDGQTLVTGGADGTARQWYVAAPRRKGAPFFSNLRLESVAFSPDGKILVTAGDDGTVRLWNPYKLKRFAPGRSKGASLTLSGPVLAVAFNPDGTTLATAGADGTARLWDVAATATHPQVGAPLPAGPGRVTDVAFSADGKILATTGRDGKIRLWNIFLPHDLVGPVCSIADQPISKRQWGTYIKSVPFQQVCQTDARAVKQMNSWVAELRKARK